MARAGLVAAAGCAAISCAMAGILVARRIKNLRKWWRIIEIVEDFEEKCSTPTARLRQVVDAMVVEMHAGLASDGGSKLKMLITFVDKLPNGNEKGIYYALDLGGTNVRVLRVQPGGRRPSVISRHEVFPRKILRHEVEQQPIPQNLMTSTSEDLFDFIAMTLKNYIDREDDGFEHGLHRSRELGFTFSFPVKQLSVSSGVLTKCTKGFAIEDAVGRDVAQCLEEAMTNRGLDLRVAALVNDTVGTLALGHYYDEDTVAAVIIGTGTNACYVEHTDAIIKCQGLHVNSGGMVVNMEWGNFWSSHLPRTSYDVALDDESPNPRDQGFEKMISGMYLADIARRVLYRIAQESDIFGDSAASLSVPFVLSIPLMAAMHEDDSPDLKVVDKILQENLQMVETSLKARRLIVTVCEIVTQRAARLAAAGIVAILKKIGRDGSGGAGSGRTKEKIPRSVVAIEGGLYTGYSLFREYLNEAVVEILGEEVAQNVVLRVCEDGTGIGAALLAASISSDR